MSTIGFVGFGNMGKALAEGLIRDDHHQVLVQDPNLSLQEGIEACDYHSMRQRCDAIVIAIKPQSLPDFFESTQPSNDQTLIISVVAGATTVQLQQGLKLAQSHPIVRAMPNTPSLIHQGMTGLFASQAVREDLKQLAQTIMNGVGESVWVNTEDEIDAITALSGSGPAYFYLFLESMIEAGVKLGLSQDIATQCALATGKGACLLASQSEDDLNLLRAKVTSKGGTTEAGIQSLIQAGLGQTVENALKAAKERAKELSSKLN